IVAADAVDWIGEPDGAVSGDDSIVRRIQVLAIIAVCDDRDRAVELGASHPSAAMLASDQASFAIDGIAVRITGELIGKIHIPETVANLCFGGQQRNRLYICGSTSLYAVYTSVQGAMKP